MRKRIGNDIRFTWHIMRHEGDTSVPESFTGKDVTVELITPSLKLAEISDIRIDTGIVTFTFPGKSQTEYGAYTAVLYENKGSGGMVAIDSVEAVTLVRHSFQESKEENDVIEAVSVELDSQLAAMAGSSIEPVQSDWEQEDENALDYIKNKPELSDYVSKLSESTQNIESDVHVLGVFENEDNTLEGNIRYEIVRDRNGTMIRRTLYQNGAQQSSHLVYIFGGRDAVTAGIEIVQSIAGVVKRHIRITDDVYLLEMDGDTPKKHYLSRKQDVMPVVAVESGTTAITAVVNTYYEVAGTVETLAITLPVPSATDKVRTVMVHLTTGANPAVTIGSTTTVDRSSTFAIDANKEYEINCAYNGDKWIIAEMEVTV